MLWNILIPRVASIISIINDLGLSKDQVTQIQNELSNKFHDSVKIVSESINPTVSESIVTSNPSSTPSPISNFKDIKILQPLSIANVNSQTNPTTMSKNTTYPKAPLFFFDKLDSTKPTSETKHNTSTSPTNSTELSSDSSSTSSSEKELEKTIKKAVKPSYKKKTGKFILPDLQSENIEKEQFKKDKKAHELKHKWAKQHMKNEKQAFEAKKNYLNIKLKESKNTSKSTSGELVKLKKLKKELKLRCGKFKTVQANIDMIVAKIDAELENLQTFKNNGQDEINDIKSKIRMTQNEIAHLYKKLNREKEHLQEYLDRIRVIKDRFGKYEEQVRENQIKKEINQKRYQEYEQLANTTERALLKVQNKIQELENKIAKEQQYQTKIEIEKNASEEKIPLPLFLATA